jgi:hypothetical protein
MIKFIKRKLKRRAVKRQLLKLKDVYDYNDPGMLADINVCMFICRNAIKHKNTTFELTPISNERVIENKKMGIFVILDDKKITVINHVCYYSNIPMSDRDWKKLITMYDNKVQEIRKDKIRQMKAHVEYSLEKLKNKVVTKLKTPTVE